MRQYRLFVDNVEVHHLAWEDDIAFSLALWTDGQSLMPGDWTDLGPHYDGPAEGGDWPEGTYWLEN